MNSPHYYQSDNFGIPNARETPHRDYHRSNMKKSIPHFKKKTRKQP